MCRVMSKASSSPYRSTSSIAVRGTIRSRVPMPLTLNRNEWTGRTRNWTGREWTQCSLGTYFIANLIVVHCANTFRTNTDITIETPFDKELACCGFVLGTRCLVHSCFCILPIKLLTDLSIELWMRTFLSNVLRVLISMMSIWLWNWWLWWWWRRGLIITRIKKLPRNYLFISNLNLS